MAGICPLRIICAVWIPAMAPAAEWKALKPTIGRVIHLMKRAHCNIGECVREVVAHQGEMAGKSKEIRVDTKTRTSSAAREGISAIAFVRLRSPLSARSPMPTLLSPPIDFDRAR